MMEIYQKNHKLFRKGRFLFTIDGCRLCAMYYEFISRYNINLPPEKRIRIINCSAYHDYGFKTDPRIEIFMPYIGGIYPSLFIDGIRIQGANSVEELEAFLSSLLSDDFYINPKLRVEVEGKEYPITFNQDCKYEKTFFGRRLVCR